jgi:hypothetical protein
MLLHSLRALCKAPGGAGSIWKYLEVLPGATGVSGRFGYGFRTELHFANVKLYYFTDTYILCSIFLHRILQFPKY